jgi:hypothetical protein
MRSSCIGVVNPSHLVCRSNPRSLEQRSLEALRTLVGLTRLLHDAPVLHALQEDLSPCRQLALQALWNLQQLDPNVEHALVHELVRCATSCLTMLTHVQVVPELATAFVSNFDQRSHLGDALALCRMYVGPLLPWRKI